MSISFAYRFSIQVTKSYTSWLFSSAEGLRKKAQTWPMLEPRNAWNFSLKVKQVIFATISD